MDSDQQTQVINNLKIENYDLSKTANEQGQFIMQICQKLGISVAEGVDPKDVMSKIEELTKDVIQSN